MSEYTPTTEDVQAAYTHRFEWEADPHVLVEQFDRWLRRDRARERAEALEEARAEMRRMMDGFPQRGRHTRATWALSWLDNTIARIRSDAGIGGGGSDF